MVHPGRDAEQIEVEGDANESLYRHTFPEYGIGPAGVSSAGAELGLTGGATEASDPNPASVDARVEAKKIAYSRIGNGDKILMISGFPQTARFLEQVNSVPFWPVSKRARGPTGFRRLRAAFSACDN